MIKSILLSGGDIVKNSELEILYRAKEAYNNGEDFNYEELSNVASFNDIISLLEDNYEEVKDEKIILYGFDGKEYIINKKIKKMLPLRVTKLERVKRSLGKPMPLYNIARKTGRAYTVKIPTRRTADLKTREGSNKYRIISRIFSKAA